MAKKDKAKAKKDKAKAQQEASALAMAVTECLEDETNRDYKDIPMVCNQWNQAIWTSSDIETLCSREENDKKLFKNEYMLTMCVDKKGEIIMNSKEGDGKTVVKECAGPLMSIVDFGGKGDFKVSKKDDIYCKKEGVTLSELIDKRDSAKIREGNEVYRNEIAKESSVGDVLLEDLSKKVSGWRVWHWLLLLILSFIVGIAIGKRMSCNRVIDEAQSNVMMAAAAPPAALPVQTEAPPSPPQQFDLITGQSIL